MTSTAANQCLKWMVSEVQIAKEYLDKPDYDCEALGHIWERGIEREHCTVCGVYFEPDEYPVSDRISVIVKKGCE